ncbi:unnamed protein product [Meloidogyne enterolobii]|uniref:Uncharacterized protein n=1 Tax=Meloidogyne enterolobii TaxID=390850 RepID=A0ACB0XVD1_MELEN
MPMNVFDGKTSELINVRITFKPNEVEHFVEIISKYFDKLTEHRPPLENIQFYADILLKMNELVLNNLLFEIELSDIQTGVYLSKILKNKIEMDCNNWINIEEEIEKNDAQIYSNRQFCQFGMLLSFGNFLIERLIKYEKKRIIKLRKMINNDSQELICVDEIEEKINKRKIKIKELNQKILNYQNYYFPIWNKAKEIIIENNEGNYLHVCLFHFSFLLLRKIFNY